MARNTATNETGGFSEDERAAMKERALEAKTAKKRGAKADGEADLLAKVAEMPEPDRSMATRLHALIKVSAPDLAAKTWYGMTAYAKDGDVLVFFQPASKFKARYSTLGFNDKANLDDGKMWPTAYALTELAPADEQRIAQLVRRAAG